MKLYTKKGDGGTTSLIGGSRVPKDDPRVEAYGGVDELGAHVAHLYDMLAPHEGFDSQRKELVRILEELMCVAAMLATDDGGRRGEETVLSYSIQARSITRLEQTMNEYMAQCPPVKYFALPCGHPLVSWAHICRTVCRRAERACVAASHTYMIDHKTITYLNRLSDYLYALARLLAVRLGTEEKHWIPQG